VLFEAAGAGAGAVGPSATADFLSSNWCSHRLPPCLPAGKCRVVAKIGSCRANAAGRMAPEARRDCRRRCESIGHVPWGWGGSKLCSGCLNIQQCVVVC
jgi:hypothetical protein